MEDTHFLSQEQKPLPSFCCPCGCSWWVPVPPHHSFLWEAPRGPRDTRSIGDGSSGAKGRLTIEGKGLAMGFASPGPGWAHGPAAPPHRPALAGSEPGRHSFPSVGEQCQSLWVGKVMFIYTIFKQVYFTQPCTHTHFLIDPTCSHTHTQHPHEHPSVCGHL